MKNRIKLLALSAIASVMVLGSSLALAEQSTNSGAEASAAQAVPAASEGVVIGGGIGRNLKK